MCFSTLDTKKQAESEVLMISISILLSVIIFFIALLVCYYTIVTSLAFLTKYKNKDFLSNRSTKACMR